MTELRTRRHSLAALRRYGRTGALTCALLLLAACAGTPTPSVPPLRPDLPDDLRQSEAEMPDFRRPPNMATEPVKTDEEKQQAIEELETLRDSHESTTRQKIERR